MDSLWCQTENQVVQPSRLKGARVQAIKSISFVHIIHIVYTFALHVLVRALCAFFWHVMSIFGHYRRRNVNVTLNHNFILLLRLLRCVRTVLRTQTGNHTTSSLTFLEWICDWWRLPLGWCHSWSLSSCRLTHVWLTHPVFYWTPQKTDTAKTTACSHS